MIKWCELHLENPEASPNEPDDDFARRSRLCRPVPGPDKAIFKDVNMPELFDLLVVSDVVKKVKLETEE